MKPRSSVEIERTFELPPGAALPDFTGIGGIATVQALGVEDLDATYWDTEDLRLARSRATLRRRTGGRDAGWHLKLPLTEGREEVTLPLGRGTSVPAELRALVRSRARKAPLRPAVVLKTQRTVQLLLDDEGRVLAEVADDTVTADVLNGEGPGTWREVEVELVTGDRALLDAVEDHLRAHGGDVSVHQSKLGRALGERGAPRRTKLPKHPTAADAVLRHLREQVDELVRQAPSARRDLPDGVHKARVSTRRLRSALKTYRPLLDRSVTDPLRQRLKELADVLGGARDAEVMRDRLLAAVDTLPDDLVVGPVAERIRAELGAQHAAAHARLVTELDGARFVALLEALDALLEAPPWTERAARTASTELPRCVRRSVRHLDAAVAALDGSDLRLHDVRKAAKQLRYAAESVVVTHGRPAARLAKRAQRVQDLLGEHQDSVVTRQRLRELGAKDGFTFGVLVGREEAHAAQARAALPTVLHGLDDKKARAWLTA